jgi:undecaprenyl-diphosphatase
MLEQILEYERGAFLWLNGSHNTFWDNFMWLYTGQIVWIPALLLIIFLLFYKQDWKEALLIVLSIVLLFTLCDQFSSSICKPYFMRLRPTHHPDFMEYVKIVNDYRGGSYGFISGHAANAFGFAVFTLLLFRNRLFTISILLWSTLMAYSRIYLGVHFISDIIPGILTGTLFGFGIYRLYVFLRHKLLKKNDNRPRHSELVSESPIPLWRGRGEVGGIIRSTLIILALLATNIYIIVYSFIK